MKVAVIIGGDTRTFEDCYPSLESNILRYNSCDVYLHLYEEPATQKAIELLRPVDCIVEDKAKIKHSIASECYSNKPPETDCLGVFFQWRTVKLAFQLLTKYHYDVILKTRYDIKYTNPLKIDTFDPARLNVPVRGDWRGGLFDMLAFASKPIMENYCSLYDKINSYVVSGIPCHSELLNRHNNRNIPVNRFDYTVLLRRKFDRDFIEDRIFTL